jgi:hypothetical protein
LFTVGASAAKYSGAFMYVLVKFELASPFFPDIVPSAIDFYSAWFLAHLFSSF